jgi:hypothetical protein
MATKVPGFSNEAIVSSIGVTVVQALDFYTSSMNLSKETVRALWSPYLAAMTRIVKPADNMVQVFINASENKVLKEAMQEELNSPNIDFYDTFNESLRAALKMMTESVRDCSYMEAIENLGNFDKKNMAEELNLMIDFYMGNQNDKGRKIQGTDEIFKKVYCTVLPQHVEDTMSSYSLNGTGNTGQIVQLGQVVFGTTLLLQIISGML